MICFPYISSSHLPHPLWQARSARGKRLIDFSTNPDSPRATATKLTATERSILSVRERSSFQLSDGCFIPDMKPPPVSPITGRVSTRSQLLELRRQEWKADNARTSYPVELSTTMPVGRMPGAPGKRHDVQRFSHLDTGRGHRFWWGMQDC